MEMLSYKSVDDYLKTMPTEQRIKLEKIREIIRKEAPDAVEGIGYGMPSYKLNGRPLAYFAGFRDHVSFFPAGSGIIEFAKELEDYKTSRGTIQFPLEGRLPVGLIRKIVKFRVKENNEKERSEKVKKENDKKVNKE